jgi:hypothetical protein
LTVELVETIKEKRDIPVVLENITMEDDYEGDFTKRRVLLYTLRFTAKTYLFGPVSSATKDVIKRATVSYLTGTDTSNSERALSYSVTPRATKNYTGDSVTNLSDDVTKTAKTINVDSASDLTAKTYVDIGGEEIYIKQIDGTKLSVLRAQDGTAASTHLKGDAVFVIDTSDNTLIEEGDDFGFSGSIS